MTSEEYKEQLSEALGKLAGVHAVGDSWITFDGSIPAGGVPFTGQLVTRAMYADLWAWVQANKTVVADAEWQTTANAQNGMNAAYSSGDGSTTFRLPCVVGGYLQVGDTSTAGQYVKEGLPYFGGSIQGVVTDEGYGTGIFSFQQTKLENLSIVASGAKAAGTFTLSPPSVYGSSDHVTPETFKVMVGVYAFGVTGPVGESTEAGLVAEMNHKADIDASNFSTAGKNVLAGMGMPSARYVNLTLGASGTQYTAPANGWFTLEKATGVTNLVYMVAENIETSYCDRVWAVNGQTKNTHNLHVPARKGESVRISYNFTGAVSEFRFIYAEGATD